MAAVRRGPAQSVRQSRRSKTDNAEAKSVEQTTVKKSSQEIVVSEHLPPLFLILTVMVCSGAIFVFGVRDFLTTGKIIAGSWDAALMDFTKSTQWYEDAKGWKSTQGGFSAIQQVTTDANNMGGFFIRKLAGATALTVQLQKLLPLLVHPTGAQWVMGHFRPLLGAAFVTNLAMLAFLHSYLDDLTTAKADMLPRCAMGLLAFESLVLAGYLVMTWHSTKMSIAVAMPNGKTPHSFTSNIVTRTVVMVTGIMSLIAGRDFFFPGVIVDFIPRDDIYLEWTNALLHSPPDGSPEAQDQGLEAPFFIGDKFIAQYAALNILIMCLYKFITAVTRFGSDGSGEIKCRMIWKAQAIGDACILFLLRLFTPAANSASLDLRWHLMSLAYETFILGLYGYM